MGIIGAELANRLQKLGLKKNATAGATVEGNLGAFNTTLINSIGKEVAISRKEDAFDFVDKKVKEAIDRYVLDEDGQLRFQSLGEFVDHTTNRNIRQGATDSLKGLTDNFRFAMSVVTGNEDFITRPFEDVVNCIEYATFISVISKVYYPDTQVRTLMFTGMARKPEGKAEIIAKKIFDRHAYFIFRDKDGKEYLSVFGQKVRPIEEGIEALEKMFERNKESYAHVPKLVSLIRKEQAKLQKA